MAGETVITQVGNLTADPELRYTQSGIPVVNFTIASTPKTFDKQSGQWKDGEALFMRCSAWRDFAEHIAGSLTKGMRVVAQGNLRQRNYETREGERRTSVELDVQEIGPSLRYATAAVTRTERGTSPAQRPAPAASAPGWDGNTWDSQSAPQTPAPAADQWAAQPIPGTDETPF